MTLECSLSTLSTVEVALSWVFPSRSSFSLIANASLITEVSLAAEVSLRVELSLTGVISLPSVVPALAGRAPCSGMLFLTLETLVVELFPLTEVM